MAYEFEDIQKYGKEQFDAAAAATSSFAKTLQAIATETADYSKKSFENGSAFLEKLLGAKSYDTAIQLLGKRFGEKRYRHDLILLGLGEDGHTASLFPETAALEETQKSVVSNFVPKFDTHRLTFTFPLINAARCVAFVINDKTKQPVIDRVLAGNSGLPSERVKPVDGEVLWFLGHGK